jgi:hypothetical protein
MDATRAVRPLMTLYWTDYDTTLVRASIATGARAFISDY